MDPQEKNKYWEIFRGLNPENGYLSGSKAAGVLRSSKLSSDKLEKIWDLAGTENMSLRSESFNRTCANVTNMDRY